MIGEEGIIATDPEIEIPKESKIPVRLFFTCSDFLMKIAASAELIHDREDPRSH
jgi:hypothetical protein